MAVGLVAYINVLDGKSEAFEAKFKKNAVKVRENEPGNQLYKLFRSRESSNEYVIMEIYDDQAAFDVHVNSDHLRDSRPIMAELRDGKAKVVMLDAV